MTKLGLVLVLHLISWDSGVNFLDQSQSVTKVTKIQAIQDQFWYSNTNCSKSEINWNHKLRFQAFMVTPLSSYADGRWF